MANLFFDPPELETLYALTHLDGQQRCDVLKIKRIHYAALKKANEWLERIMADLHICHTSGHTAFQTHGQAAYDQLFKLWSRMADKGIEDYPYPSTVSWYEPPVSEDAALQANLEGMVESLVMGRNAASDVKELIQEQFCQPTINEGAFAEYFKQTYGQCPDRVLFVGEVPNQVNHMANLLAQEFDGAQTGGQGRGRSYVAVNPLLGRAILDEKYVDGIAQYLQILPTIDHLTLSMQEEMHPRLTRRLVVLDLLNSQSTFNDLTFALNFFGELTVKPRLLIVLAREPLPIDGPTIYC